MCVSACVCTGRHAHRAVELFCFIVSLLLFKNSSVPFVEEFTAELESLIRQLEFRHEVSKQSEQLVHPCAVLAAPWQAARAVPGGCRGAGAPGAVAAAGGQCSGVGTRSRLRAQLCGGRGGAGQAGARGARGLLH